ncbi:hypothetical protein HED63_25435 [Ochrobactrum cytisi]|nr:hypothetical protein [Brucella cytisi]
MPPWKNHPSCVCSAFCHRNWWPGSFQPCGSDSCIWNAGGHLRRRFRKHSSARDLFRSILVCKIDWRRPEAAAIVVSFMSFVGMCVDSRGNPIYNLPLAWIFGSQGSQVKVNEIVSHGGGSTGVNYDFQIVSLHGAIEHSISGWLVMPMRFVEYLIVLSIAVTIITIIRNHSGRNWLPDNASD